MFRKILNWICLLVNLLSCITSFNVDVKSTYMEYSLGDKDILFGYSLSLVGKNKLVVGAPPKAWPNDQMDYGGTYSCDINKKDCTKLTNERKPLVPATTTHRCFSPPFNQSCGASIQKVFYFYDPVYTECKPFLLNCRDHVPGENIFPSKLECKSECKSEIIQRAKEAKIRPILVECKILFQNMHKHSIFLYKKNPKGRETLYSARIQPGQLKLGFDVCGNLFVAKSAVTKEYLYFRDENNSFDIILREPKHGSTISISTMEESREFLYEKNNVRTGLSVMSIKEEAVSCEPQYSFRYNGPIGRCSVYKGDGSLKYNVYPFERKSVSTGYYYWNNYGYSVGGISLSKAKDNPSLIFAGAPNARRAGSIAVLSARDGRNVGVRDNPLRRQIVGANSLFGYAVSAGNIYKNRRLTGFGDGNVFGGAPRGAHLHGHVLLNRYYSGHKIYDFAYIQEIRNPDTQIGSYFGSTLCMADIDKDGNEDILIGAPYFAKVYDEGRVYVYMNKKGKNTVEYKAFLEGIGIAGERFGTAIANIGDINRDGFTDIAVGAPGGDKGSVYIFNSGPNGINEKYSQRISSSDIPNDASGFGISISGNVDVNGDSYSDIAIGAYTGKKAYVFKSNPVVKLYASQKVNTTNIPPEQKFVNCIGPNGILYHCINLEFTLFYKDKGTPDTFDVDVAINLDANKVLKRAKLMRSKALTTQLSRKINLKRDVPMSFSEIVYIKVDTYGEKTDIFSPIELLTTYKASEVQTSCVKGNPCGILAEKKETKSILGYEVRCDNSSFCKPYLQVSSSLHFPKPQKSEEIIYGVTRQIAIRSKIKNTAETAYRPMFFLNFRSDFDIDNIKMNGRSLQWDVADIQEMGLDKKLIVALPHTIHLNNEVSIDVQFSIVSHKPSTSNYTFFINATAIGSDRRAQKDNTDTINIKTKIETCIRSTANVEPSIIIYKKRDAIEQLNKTSDLTQYGYEALYTFYVQNSGGNTLDSLIAEVKAIERLDSDTFMCIEDMFVDQVPCKKAPTCSHFVGQEKKKDYTTDEVEELKDKSTKPVNVERKYKTVTCPMNSLEVGQGATVSMKVIYFTKLIKKLREKESNFTSSFRIYHKDEKTLQNLYYQRANCTSTDDVTIKFIRGIEKTMKEDVPIWVIILSIIIAVFLLLILIAVLLKYGFFKRNRAKDISTPLSDKTDFDEDEDEEN